VLGFGSPSRAAAREIPLERGLKREFGGPRKIKYRKGNSSPETGEAGGLEGERYKGVMEEGRKGTKGYEYLTRSLVCRLRHVAGVSRDVIFP